MQFAMDQFGKRRAPAVSGEHGTCECCGDAVVAKCGWINEWHWAHVTREDCDPWTEPVSIWHRAWQTHLSRNHDAEVEVVVRRDGEAHRADALLPNGIVVELQHSAISVDEILAREAFYGTERMVWVFNCRDAVEEGRLDLRDRGTFHSFRWKHARKSIAHARAKVRLDLGDGLVMALKRMHLGPPCGGWGTLNYVAELDGTDW